MQGKWWEANKVCVLEENGVCMCNVIIETPTRTEWLRASCVTEGVAAGAEWITLRASQEYMHQQAPYMQGPKALLTVDEVHYYVLFISLKSFSRQLYNPTTYKSYVP